MPLEAARSQLQRFCAQVRDRSRENRTAFALLCKNRLFGPALALVRQELDSMIRVIYLLELADPSERRRLILDSIEGRHWSRPTPKGKAVRITDREMAELALKRHTWVRQVYQFGCNLIHLSDWHGYQTADPTKNMTPDDRASVLEEIERVHAKRFSELTFTALLEHAPFAIEKIADNLECYLKDLEKLETTRGKRTQSQSRKRADP